MKTLALRLIDLLAAPFIGAAAITVSNELESAYARWKALEKELERTSPGDEAIALRAQVAQAKAEFRRIDAAQATAGAELFWG